jgi:hypothetical protein
MSRVTLINLQFNTSGNYKCEVSTEAPNFETVAQNSNMTVMGKYKFSILCVTWQLLHVTKYSFLRKKLFAFCVILLCSWTGTFQSFSGWSNLHYKVLSQTYSKASRRSRRKRVGIKNIRNKSVTALWSFPSVAIEFEGQNWPQAIQSASIHIKCIDGKALCKNIDTQQKVFCSKMSNHLCWFENGYTEMI